MTVELRLSPNNKKVVSGQVCLVGELMKNPREIRANRVFENADKELRISYQIEEASTLSFNNGTMIGDVLDSENPWFQWHVFKKTSGVVTTMEETSHPELHIGELSVKPFLFPLSGTRAKLALVVFPLSKEKLSTDHPNSVKAAFPGVELTSMEIDMFPLMDVVNDKNWGCPIIPLLNMGGSVDDHPNIPPTDQIRSKVSTILRTAIKPEIKRDLTTLKTAWQNIKDRGPSVMKERQPDLIWPAASSTTREGQQTGESHFLV